MKKNDCYQCPHRGEVPGSAHSTCNFLPPNQKSAVGLLGMIGKLPTITDKETGEVVLEFNEVGVKKGWCAWPINFDPVWVTCNLPIEKPENAG